MHFCHQVLWPELDVQFVSVTDQWAQYAVAGPRSRELLERCSIPAATSAMPHFRTWRRRVTLQTGSTAVCSASRFRANSPMKLRCPRVSGDALMRQLFEAGADMGVTAYGLESLNVMRIEKGHMTGNELNGQTTAYDLGMARMCRRRKISSAQ